MGRPVSRDPREGVGCSNVRATTSSASIYVSMKGVPHQRRHHNRQDTGGLVPAIPLSQCDPNRVSITPYLADPSSEPCKKGDFLSRKWIMTDNAG